MKTTIENERERVLPTVGGKASYSLLPSNFSLQLYKSHFLKTSQRERERVRERFECNR